MKGGHNKKPSSQKKLEGTDRKDRKKNHRPALPPGKVPPPPRGYDATQRATWRELALQVEALGNYSASRYTAFRLMVETVALTRRKEAGTFAPTAIARVLQSASSQLAHFGLDPASEDKVTSGVGVGAAAAPQQQTAAPGEQKPNAPPPLFGPPLKVVQGGGGGGPVAS
jgi:hypothetical protein